MYIYKKHMMYLFVTVIVFYIIYRLLDYKFELFNYKSNELTNYIASRSYSYVCDHRINNPQTESIEIPLTYPKSNGETIYINTTAIPNFVLNYLPNIKYKFVLVSGDTDATIPDDYNMETQIILRNPLLLKWYAQNLKLINSKLTQLPIGLDLHTLTTNQKWGSIQTVEEQIIDIERIKSIKLNKENKCYSNFHFTFDSNHKYIYDRKDAYNQIQKELVFYEPNKIPRIESWKNMIKYKYVISPFGNGLDCHRTWEAIILGCIPIVKKSELSTMYDGLPVLIVDNWTDINQKLLDEYNPNYEKIEKIYMKYWINLFNKYKTN